MLGSSLAALSLHTLPTPAEFILDDFTNFGMSSLVVAAKWIAKVHGK